MAVMKKDKIFGKVDITSRKKRRKKTIPSIYEKKSFQQSAILK